MTTFTQQRRGAYARVWLGGPYGDILATLGTAAREREGILLLTGDVGTGKSLVTQALLETLRDRDVLVGELPFPHLGPLDFFRTIATAYGLPNAFETREAFQLDFDEFLRRAAADRKKVMFVIDEAQQLTPELFPEIERLLRPESGPGRADRVPFSVLLVGQTELESILHEPSRAALARQITAHCCLRPLTEEEVAKYLAHRLPVDAGGREVSTTVIREIHRKSKGVPRVIDQVAEQILLAPPAPPAPAAAPIVVSSNSARRFERRERSHGRLQLTGHVGTVLVGGVVILALALGVTGYRIIQPRRSSPATASDSEAAGGSLEQAATSSPASPLGTMQDTQTRTTDVQIPADLQSPTASTVTTPVAPAPETQQAGSSEADRPSPRPSPDATESHPSLTSTPVQPQPASDREHHTEPQQPSSVAPRAAAAVPSREERPAPRPSSGASEPHPAVAPATKKPQTASPISRSTAAGVTPSVDGHRRPRSQEGRAEIPANPAPRASSGTTDPDPGAIIDWLLKEGGKTR